MSQRERYEKGGIGRWYWDYRDRAVIALMGEGPVLDVGCGEGITTEKISALGMDLDRGDVRGSVYDLPFKSGTFGTVLLLEVIEHLKRPLWALVEIYRVLKPGGKVVMLFPNDAIFKVAWALCFMWGEITKDRGHLRKWTSRMASNFFRHSGFKVTERKSIPFHFWPVSLHHIIVGEKC